MSKTFAGTYLFTKYSEYEREIFSFIMNGTEIDKSDSQFDDIAYEVKKRQVSNGLVKVLAHKDVILLINDKPLSKSFKVFCAKDIRGTNKAKLKVFIDCSNIITTSESGKYTCKNIDILIAYLVSAMNTMIYYMDEERFINNNQIIRLGAACFSSLFTHIVDYVCKISTMPDIKAKCIYLSSLYYIGCILGKDPETDGSKKIARDLSGLSVREADILHIQITEEYFTNIKFFVEKLSDIIHISKLTLDVIVEKWMYVYGTGTIFALEIFPNFSSMITDTYVGCYINNQKTIEKITRTNMVEFTKVILSIGADSV